MRDHKMFFQTALIQITFRTAIKNACEITSTIALLMNLQMLFKITA